MTRNKDSAKQYVGLYLDQENDSLASDLARVRGTSKSLVYASGVRLVLDSLTADERAALAAIRRVREAKP
jgi:hypothetical protein